MSEQALGVGRAASAPLDEVLRGLDSSADGLSGAEASARLQRHGPNAVRTHRVSAIAVLGRQLRNAVLILLAGTAAVSFFLGDNKQAIIIGVILAESRAASASRHLRDKTGSLVSLDSRGVGARVLYTKVC